MREEADGPGEADAAPFADQIDATKQGGLNGQNVKPLLVRCRIDAAQIGLVGKQVELQVAHVNPLICVRADA